MIVIWLFMALFGAFCLILLIALATDLYYQRLRARPLKIAAAELNEMRTTVKFHNVPKEGDHD